MAVNTPSIPQASLEQTQRQRSRRRLLALLAPSALWLGLFFVLPFAIVVIYSFLSRGPTGAVEWRFNLGNYARLFTDPIYLTVFLRSLWVGVLTTLCCLILGYPLALFIARRGRRWRATLVLLILIPFWTNFLVRTYAWMVILNNNGLINTLLRSLGLPTLTLMNTEGAVLMGLIYGELPFMVLPIYASLSTLR